jgi:hypothetical protein
MSRSYDAIPRITANPSPSFGSAHGGTISLPASQRGMMGSTIFLLLEDKIDDCFEASPRDPWSKDETSDKIRDSEFVIIEIRARPHFN